MPNLDDFRRYAVATSDSDSAMLEMCMNAAVEWYKNAGVDPPETQSALYDMGIYMLALHFYDNRGAVDVQSVGELPFGVFSIMHQLRS